MTTLFRLLLALVAALATACSAEADAPRAAVTAELEPAPVEPSSALVVWAHDPELEAAALSAAERIYTATGLVVAVNAPDSLATAVPMFRTTAGLGKWRGVTYLHDGPQWVAIGANLEGESLDAVVLHEILHCVGAGHLDDGRSGLLADPPDVPTMTAADLELVCGAAACEWFAPEGE